MHTNQRRNEWRWEGCFRNFREEVKVILMGDLYPRVGSNSTWNGIIGAYRVLRVNESKKYLVELSFLWGFSNISQLTILCRINSMVYTEWFTGDLLGFLNLSWWFSLGSFNEIFAITLDISKAFSWIWHTYCIFLCKTQSPCKSRPSYFGQEL